MMPTLVILAALAAKPLIVPADHGFHVAVERFVADAVRPTRLDGIVGERSARWLAMAGCEHAACRKEAETLLSDPGQYRAVLWGAILRHDVQARSLCEAVLAGWICPHCGGLGRTPNPEWPGYYLYCTPCSGTGRGDVTDLP